MVSSESMITEVRIFAISEGQGHKLRRGTRVLSGVMEMFCILIWTVVTWGMFIDENTKSCLLKIRAFYRTQTTSKKFEELSIFSLLLVDEHIQTNMNRSYYLFSLFIH